MDMFKFIILIENMMKIFEKRTDSIKILNIFKKGLSE